MTLTVCALLFVAFPTTSAAEAPVTMISSNGEFNLNADHQQRCDGQLAITVADLPGCTFEPDTRQGFGMTIGFLSINAGNGGAIPLTGTVTAHLESASGREVVFGCTWNNGVFSTCAIGTYTGWPNIGEGFTFTCASEAGALGNWGECFVEDY